MAANKKQIKILKEYQGFQPNDICEIVYTKPKSDDPDDGWYTIVLIGTTKSSVADMEHEGKFWVFIDQELEDAANKAYPINLVKLSDSVSIDSGLSVRKAFKSGAEWQKEQSATDAIEFGKWWFNNGFTYNRKENHWRKYPLEKRFTDDEMIELWQQSKNK